MPTSSQPLMRRANTNPSCCSVWPCLVSPQFKLNCKCFMHHTRTRAIFVFSWTIWFNYKRGEETPVQWDAIGSDTKGRERISVYICVSILSQETGEWKGKTSCTCGWRILEWCWGETLWGRTIHFHLLQEVQSTTLIRQGELQITTVLPQ